MLKVQLHCQHLVTNDLAGTWLNIASGTDGKFNTILLRRAVIDREFINTIF